MVVFSENLNAFKGKLFSTIETSLLELQSEEDEWKAEIKTECKLLNMKCVHSCINLKG